MTRDGRPAAQRPWPEIDLFRGLAVVAMLFNHLAAGFFSLEVPRPALVHAGLWVGGLAPVFFFLATGLGSGIQAALGKSSRGVASKALILVAADFFLRWMHGGGSGLGLDFLAFIGLSMLVLDPVRRAEHPLRIALGGAVAILALRFGVAPLIPDDSLGLLQIFGRYRIAGISYPLLPWLAIPLLGFALGYVAQSRRDRFDELAAYWGPRLAGLAVACGLVAISLWLQSRGMRAQRYGMMSTAYLPLALGGSLGALWIAHAWTRAAASSVAVARGAELTSARGLASLAVVPIHYAIIRCAAVAFAPLTTASGYFLACVLLAVVSMGAARLVDRMVAAHARHPAASRTWALLAAFACATGVCLAAMDLPPLARPILAGVGQLATCALVGLPLPQPFQATSHSPKPAR